MIIRSILNQYFLLRSFATLSWSNCSSASNIPISKSSSHGMRPLCRNAPSSEPPSNQYVTPCFSRTIKLVTFQNENMISYISKVIIFNPSTLYTTVSTNLGVRTLLANIVSVLFLHRWNSQQHLLLIQIRCYWCLRPFQHRM